MRLLSIVLFVSQLCFAQSNMGVPIDYEATDQTKALLYNLSKIVKEDKTIFGQQDATLYGRNWIGGRDRSDVKDLVGNHPGVVGLDFEHVTYVDEYYRQSVIDTLIQTVKEIYANGYIVTFSWHMANPANDGDFYWEKNPVTVVKDILPNGKFHDNYISYLKQMASVVMQFKGDKGEPIPFIFRPFHEFDGEWFWWGKGHRTKEEFIELWQFTVDYFRNELNLHNMLYAFSPDCRFNDQSEYLECYPGDDYVDILGMDNYWDFRPDGNNNPKDALRKLQIVVDVAKSKNKIPALTETGLEQVSDSTWYTKTLLPIIREARVAYVMVWRNSNDDSVHYYTPTIGHHAAEDFKEFCLQPDILLQNELINIYQIDK